MGNPFLNIRISTDIWLQLFMLMAKITVLFYMLLLPGHSFLAISQDCKLIILMVIKLIIMLPISNGLHDPKTCDTQ